MTLAHMIHADGALARAAMRSVSSVSANEAGDAGPGPVPSVASAAATVVVTAVQRHLSPGRILDVSALDAAADDVQRGWALLRPSAVGTLEGGLIGAGVAPGITGATIRWSHIREAAGSIGAVEDAALGPELIRRTRQEWGLTSMDTAERYRDPHQPADPWVGPVVRERAALHDSYVRIQLAGATAPASGTPAEVMVIGVPGAGKSTLLAQLKVSGELPGDVARNAVRVDADDAKELLPEYRDLMRVGDQDAGTAVQRESTLMAHHLQEAARQRGLNIVAQRSGRHPEDIDDLRIMAERGYQTTLLVVDVPPSEAIRRATRRAGTNDRLVPPAYIYGAANSIKENALRALETPDVNVVRVFNQEGRETVSRRGPSGPVTVAENILLGPIAERAASQLARDAARSSTSAPSPPPALASVAVRPH